MATSGQLALKQGMTKVGMISVEIGTLPPLLLKAFLTPFVLLGLALYIISAMMWLIVLSRVDLSFAYPMVAIGYIIVVFLSWLLFKEDVTVLRILGCLAIALGVTLISRS